MTDVTRLAIKELEKRVDEAGSQAALAEKLGVSTAYLNDVLRGRRDPGKKILEGLGFDKIVIHIRKQDKSKVIKAIESTGVTSRHF